MTHPSAPHSVDGSAAAANDLPPRPRAPRKLQKRCRRESSLPVDLPEPLRAGDSDDETSPNNAPAARGGPVSVNMNQSIFGLIAAAGSKVDFNERFDDGSSEDDDGPEQPRRDLAQTAILKPHTPDAARRHKRLSGHRLLRSLATLPKRIPKPERGAGRPSVPLPLLTLDDRSASTELAEPDENRLAPVMSRMLQARAEMSSRPSFDLERPSSADLSGVDDGDNHMLLARRLKDIFEFDDVEQVVAEYPCWLLQSVLLQGFLYITAKHICFYSYLPKKANVVAKSGYLSKSGRRNPRYNRYWFRLKGDVLSYYRDSTNLYFPHGQIDLSVGISADVVDRGKNGVHFEVVTSHRTYSFKADSAPSAKDWVKSLQRVIFRSHNDGDSVKISLPIDNVIDVEETQMMEFSETCKIRVVDNDETYAIDEYFFSFFKFGEEAVNVLKILVEDASGNEAAEAVAGLSVDGSPRDSKNTSRSNLLTDRARSTKLPETVKATLSPLSTHSGGASPRPSLDVSSRTSFDAVLHMGRRSHDVPSPLREQGPRRSFSGSRSQSLRRRSDRSRPVASSDSNVPSSTDEPGYSNVAVSTTEDPSASQILRGSEVFHSPTMRQSPASSPCADARPGLPHHCATTGHMEQLAYRASLDPGRSSTPSLQSITKMGSYPLQRAGAFADYLNKTGKRMSSLFAAESMGYVEKVSGMWKGGHKHYDDPHGLRPDDDDLEQDSEGKVQTSMDRFRAHFALPDAERLQATYFGYIVRVLPLYGKIYISDRSFCFRSLLPGTRTKLILPLKDVETAHKEKGFRFGYAGLVVVIRGHEELFFEFGPAEVRDDCAVTLLQSLETNRFLQASGVLRDDEADDEDSAMAERDALSSARQGEYPEHEIEMPSQTHLPNAPTILMDDPDGSFLSFKPAGSMRITCLTIGSRGDVQPYIALCKGLLADGHRPRIATHAEFQGWVESHGIEFRRVEGDPGELMRLCIENGTFTLSFLREANAKFRDWLDDLLDSAYHACEGSELLIESPSAMAGIHIAEKLAIPYFRAFTMPWTRTRAYPHSFIMPEHKMGGAYNYMTYVMFDNIFWRATAQQVNRWRNSTLKLPNTSLEKMQPNKVPFLYNFSPSVVAPPLDYSDWIRVTGYWFLDEGDEYSPPRELEDFIQKARDDGKKLVYVGFGSIIVDDPGKMTQEVIDAVLKADVRCILSKGWSDRISPGDDPEKPRPREPDIPPELFVIKSAPHDWLFRRIDAAAHHGGSGTTGASLRAGIPTIIRPFFGDQFFFASRVEDLGVGVWVRRWGTNSFGRALWEATRNERIIVKARVLGEHIRQETGVADAIQSIYRDLEYAKSLIKRKPGSKPDGEEDDEAEESWTFVGGDEPDPDVVTRRLSEGIVGQSAESKGLGSQVLKGRA